MCTDATGPILRAMEAARSPTSRSTKPMQYLPLFLLFVAVLIAAWFYVQKAKTRDAGTTTVAHTDRPVEPPTASTPASSDHPE
jgi:hypothetical protein